MLQQLVNGWPSVLDREAHLNKIFGQRLLTEAFMAWHDFCVVQLAVSRFAAPSEYSLNEYSKLQDIITCVPLQVSKVEVKTEIRDFATNEVPSV